MDLKLDFECGRTPLFVRQTVAVAFGIPLGQEFTWNSLTALVREAVHASPPPRISVLGLTEIGVTLPNEAKMVSALLRALKEDHPEVDISVALNR